MKQKEEIELEKGNFKDIDYISPSYIDKEIQNTLK